MNGVKVNASEGCRSKCWNGLSKTFTLLFQPLERSLEPVKAVFGKPVKACQRCHSNRWNGPWEAAQASESQ